MPYINQQVNMIQISEYRGDEELWMDEQQDVKKIDK